MSKILFDEQPVVIPKSLIKAVGMREAAILQQLHYLIRESKHEYEGKKWTYNTYQGWYEHCFDYMSVATIKKAFLKLEKMGLVITTDKFNKMKIDKTKWYSINYEELNKLNSIVDDMVRPSDKNYPSSRPNLSDGADKKDPNDEINFIPAITKETQRNPKNKKNKQKNSAPAELLDESFEQFWNAGLVKINKAKAKQSFKRQFEQSRKHSTVQEFTQMLVKDIRERLRVRQFGFTSLHPTTYLNNQRWEDEIVKSENANQPPKDFRKNQFDDSSGDWAKDLYATRDKNGKVIIVDKTMGGL